jgi:MFS family permease
MKSTSTEMTAQGVAGSRSTVRLGLRENAAQFSLLVLVNAFVGAMVGIERTTLPLIAEKEFGLASKSAILSFIISFGIVKALSNLLAGRISDRVGRKRVLVLGWLIGIPVPLLVIIAPTWGWIVLANVLLGINQGLCWSTTVIMKIDLVGPDRRGLAMGLNEFAGYLAVAVSAFVTGYIASAYALRPQPFYLGIALALAGFLLSTFFVKDTKGHWSQKVSSDWTSPRPYLWRGGVLAVNENGELFKSRLSDGSQLWIHKVGGVVRGIGATADTLYVGTLKGTVYACAIVK